MKMNTIEAVLYWDEYVAQGIIKDYSVTHIRCRLNNKTGNPTNINPKGGSTVVSIMFSDCGLITGKAECSDEDFFCKIIGRTIAFLRIVEARNKIFVRRLKKEEKTKNSEWNKRANKISSDHYDIRWEPRIEYSGISDPSDNRYWGEEKVEKDPNDYTKFTDNRVMFGCADINSTSGKQIFDILTKICNGDYK